MGMGYPGVEFDTPRESRPLSVVQIVTQSRDNRISLGLRRRLHHYVEQPLLYPVFVPANRSSERCGRDRFSMPMASRTPIAAPQTQPEQQSERDRAVNAYIRGQITVDELLTIMDRHGSWIERLLRQMAAEPPPVQRFAQWLRRAS